MNIQKHVVRLTGWMFILGLVSGCSKFDWSHTDYYEIKDGHAVLVKTDDLGPSIIEKKHHSDTNSTIVAMLPDNVSLSGLGSNEVVGSNRDLYNISKTTYTIDEPYNITEIVGLLSFKPDDRHDLLETHDVMLANPSENKVMEVQEFEVAPAPSELQEAVPMRCIDLNTADEAVLMTLPGVGAKRARDIIALRNKKPFKRKSDIQKVKGIGKKTYNKLSDKLCDI